MLWMRHIDWSSARTSTGILDDDDAKRSRSSSSEEVEAILEDCVLERRCEYALELFGCGGRVGDALSR